MKRVAVFAHYDKNCIIQEYVIFFVKELKKVVDTIVFVSDCDLKENELTKIQEYIDHSIIGRHGEYDFGSYKRGYLYLRDNKKLEDCDELVFVNDSCYAPLFPFAEMFDKMSEKKVDFWGDKQQDYSLLRGPNVTYIVSHFLVFKPIVFKSNIFYSFVNDIQKEKKKQFVVRKYEVRLTTLLVENGFTWDVYCQNSKILRDEHWLFFKESILYDKCPFLRRNLPMLFTKNMYSMLQIKKFVKENTSYDENFIDETNISSADINSKTLATFLYFLCRNKITRKIVMLYTNLKLKILIYIKKLSFEYFTHKR